MSNKSRSIVWEFYKKLSNVSAQCTLCKKEIRWHGSTTNLMEHLKRKHHTYLNLCSQATSLEEPQIDEPQQVSGIELPSTIASTSSAPICSTTNTSTHISTDVPSTSTKPRKSYQTTITGTMKLKELTSSKIKQIDDLLVGTISEGYLPFTLVENSNFIKLVNALEPRYKLPSRKTLTNKLLNDKYIEVRSVVSESLNKANHISLTSDMWTSAANQGYLSVTAHFINENKLESAVLCTLQVSERHTAENIAKHIKDILAEWNISDKCFSIVTDNASVMIDVARRLSLQHVPCTAHTINLAITDVLGHSDISLFNELRHKCRKIVGFFKSSTLAATKLADCQSQLNKKVLKVKQEVVTRWNSTYIMIERLVSIKDELIMAFSYVNCPEILTAQEWNVMEDVLPLLLPPYELTEELSGEKYLTSSIVIPLIRGCQKAIKSETPKTSMGEKLKTILLDSLSRRLTPYESYSSGVCPKATILDPRFKKCAFGIPTNASNAVTELINEMKQSKDVLGPNQIVIDEGVCSRQPIDEIKSKKKKIWNFVIEEREKTEAAKGRITNRCTIQEDMRLYLSMPVIDMEDDPIRFWLKYKASMPSLAEAAFKYLSVPASSVPSERVFSKSGQICNERRNRLEPKRVDKLVFLNANHI